MASSNSHPCCIRLSEKRVFRTKSEVWCGSLECLTMSNYVRLDPTMLGLLTPTPQCYLRLLTPIYAMPTCPSMPMSALSVTHNNQWLPCHRLSLLNYSSLTQSYLTSAPLEDIAPFIQMYWDMKKSDTEILNLLLAV
jgi:hypothetical protein